MPNIDSKTEFLRATNEQQRVAVTNHLMSPEVRLAMVFAFSQLSENGATKEQLEGAIAYRDCLLNLAEPLPKKATFPEKKLNVLG